VEEAAPGPPKAKALKEVARRVGRRSLEAEFKRGIAARCCGSTPSLKESCLLDLKSVAHVPDTAVPTEKPK